MSNDEFILSTLNFSHSSVTTFETCPQSFYLSYIQAKSGQDNFFGEFGRFIHLILEKYFRGELDLFSLSKYYQDNFVDNVKAAPPPYPAGMEDKYFKFGLDFFDNFEFDREDYNILNIEAYVKHNDNGVPVVVRPDLVIGEKATGKVILVDYKTSNIYKPNGKIDEKKWEGYKRQLLLYAYYLQAAGVITINEIWVWAIRVDKFEHISYNTEDAEDARNWFLGIVNAIKMETEWNPDPSNRYFCDNICSVKSHCPIYKEK